MKSESQNEVGHAENTNNPTSIVGDVIGDTAYSERFVLKLLLKIANGDTLLEAVKEQSFEQELCTLWDMTAERDVVLYLLTHDTLNLFTFALPLIDTPRLIEIIIGTIANMCCHKEAINSLETKEKLMVILSDYLKSDDSHILIQLLRVISACIYESDKLSFWMEWFKKCDYSDILYFILKNSTNKELLMAAFENLNTISSKCDMEDVRVMFCNMFVTPEANNALYIAYTEYCKNASQDEKLERLHVILLQMILHLSENASSAEIESNPELFNNTTGAVNLLHDILISYESRINSNDIDSDFIDLLQGIYEYTIYFHIPELCDPDRYFTPCFNMWKALIPNGKDRELIKVSEEYELNIQHDLTSVMCPYMAECSDENFLKVLNQVGDEFEAIVESDIEYGPIAARRASNLRNRITENTDT